MKLYTLGTLVATASAASHIDVTPAFDWKPSNACTDSDGWNTEYPSQTGKRPTLLDDQGKKFCRFDGNNDYLVLNKKFKGNNPVDKFTVEVNFRTDFNHNGNHGNFNNWAFIDCDRSEHFNAYVTPEGKLGFSTAGKVAKWYGAQNEPIHDMITATGGFNDGQWHVATFTYNEGEKEIWVDGILMYAVQDNDREEIGKGKSKRFCFIGDGSEASNKNGARNEVYYKGDIAEIKYYERHVPPTKTAFMWGAVDGSCASRTDYGWPVEYGANAVSKPVAKIQSGMSYCEFDGADDYLAIDSVFFKGAVNKFSVRSVFRTDFAKPNGKWWDNWSLLDCDRSEHFNLVVDALNGQIVFSTAGGSQAISDTFSNTGGLNDGEWHDVTVKYDNGVKTIIIDGVEDTVVNDAGGRTKIGTNKLKRFCFIGDGSEANSHDGSRNQHHFDGDIALVAYAEGDEILPTGEPYKCNEEQCKDWDCDTWCACYDSEIEEAGTYVSHGCEEDTSESCECEE